MDNNEFSPEVSVVPFEKLLDLLLESKNEEIKFVQTNKEKIILDFRVEKKKREEGAGDVSTD
jgi:hypothetical protein